VGVRPSRHLRQVGDDDDLVVSRQTGQAPADLPGGPASPPRRVSAVLILLGTVLVAVATMAAGPIGFVALVAPHLARLLTGSPQSPLLVSGLTGSLLMVGADLLSQLVLESMPVSVVTNAVGGLYLMVALTVAARGRRSL